MALLKFHKIEDGPFPSPMDPNAFYYVQKEVVINGETQIIAEGYLTNQAGEARAIGNSLLMGNIALEVVSGYMANMQSLRLAPDIATRDTIAAEDPQINKIILVADASADPTVDAGAALYFYDVSAAEGSRFTKVGEYESMDVTFNWGDIQGGPTSTPAQLDDAVAKAHAHANKAVLDKFGETDSKPTYGGVAIGGATEWATVNW